MKLALFVLPLMMTPPCAFAAGLTVTNHSGLPIDELFASPAGKGAFGANLMEGVKKGALDDGKTAAVSEVAAGTYDFKVSAPDEGVLCTIKDVKVEGAELTLTAEQGNACK